MSDNIVKFQRKGALTTDTIEGGSFNEITKRNRERAERVARERANDNAGVINRYNLRPKKDSGGTGSGSGGGSGTPTQPII